MEFYPLIEFLDRINIDIVKSGGLQHLRHITFILKDRDFWYVHPIFALLENFKVVHLLPNLESIRVGAMRANCPGDLIMENVDAGKLHAPSQLF